MEIVYNLVVVMHFVGLASLLGGWLVQMGDRGGRRVNPAMVHGALTQLVTGLIIVGMREGISSLDMDVNNAKIGVKLGVTLVVVALAWLNRRRPTVANGLYFTIGGLTLANVIVAVMW